MGISADRLAAFVAMSAVLILIPGPSVLFVVGRALAQGRRAALISVLGNTCGAYLLVVAVAFGIGAVVDRSVALFTALKLAGAGYLVWLGFRAWRERKALRAGFRDAGLVYGGLRTFREGFVVGMTNPKSIVFFAAVLPQFVDRDQGYAAEQMLVLGLVFNILALVSDSAWGLAAAAARNWFARSPGRLSLLGGIGGLLLVCLGVVIGATESSG